jgi:hypothetical protein
MRAYRQKSSPNLGTLAILQRAGFLTQRLYLIAGPNQAVRRTQLKRQGRVVADFAALVAVAIIAMTVDRLRFVNPMPSSNAALGGAGDQDRANGESQAGL